MESNHYTVRVTKDELVFSAGHFITFDGDRCESIHGHNWRVAVDVSGPLDENSYVFDFIMLRDLMKSIVRELDHRMLLPTESRLISVEPDGPNLVARFNDRHWSFPNDECVLLPVDNTTTELIAKYLGARLRDAISGQKVPLPETMSITLEENFGQTATAFWSGKRTPSPSE